MEYTMGFIIFAVIVALAFDFMNGFHDAANSIATIVSTRVLRPHWAVLWAAFFNFIAFLFFGLHVANTIGKGIVDPAVIDPVIAVSALIGAIGWDVITWYYGIPSSSSHALIGGLAGAVIAKVGGMGALKLGGLIKIGASIVLSPLLGLILAYIFMLIVSIICHRHQPRQVDRWFRRLQLVSASLYSLGHGGNDAQKTMGIIAVLLFSAGMLGTEFHVPLWIVLGCHGAMALGTLFGGWRIVRTMGMKITKLKPFGGFCAETGGAATLFLATGLGIPVSTTHTITGAIVGVGAVTKLSAIRWGVAGRIVWAWIFTIPASALMAAFSWWLIRFILRMAG
ncbi:MAG: inorganic phosphate transporter [Bdellovibrionales bacterium RIFOXYD1_FULL_53_11]|nr:MAG: inorganic phosphate transporter [Bdellovibrionales bacterium RIFOXYD1_FULL_53_11]